MHFYYVLLYLYETFIYKELHMKFMKSILSILSIALIAGAFAGCKDDKAAADANKDATAQQDSTAAQK